MAVPVFVAPSGRLMTKALQGAAAIVGVGQTEFSKDAGRSETRLASEAIVAALADAGLGTDDVDGLVSYTIDPVEETELVRAARHPRDRLVQSGAVRRRRLPGRRAPRRRRRGVGCGRRRGGLPGPARPVGGTLRRRGKRGTRGHLGPLGHHGDAVVHTPTGCSPPPRGCRSTPPATCTRSG